MRSNIKLQIKQAGELANTKLATFERGLAELQAELRQAKADAAAAQVELAQGEPTPGFINKVKAFKGRKQYLQMKVEAVETAYDEVLAIKDDIVALKCEELDEEQRGAFERMRGLLSYGIATGQTNPDCRLLYDSLGDYLDAKTDGDRRAAHRAIDLIFQHGNLGDRRDKVAGADEEITRQFESMEAGESRSAFYNEHVDAIRRAYDARKNLS
jgi:hypothetical protein